MPINYSSFDVKNGVSSGGVTGSQRVKMDDKNYQLKPSIKDNTFFRSTKAGGSDRENYGEVISAKIAKGILADDANDTFEPVPEVVLVYDAERKRTPIASKYLEGDKVRTLDDFIQEKCANDDSQRIVLTDKKHVKFVDGSKKSADPKKREYDISGEENATLRQDIAKGIAASIITGDHDINPGNFIVVQKNGEERVSRIDFGHAFNDLLNASKTFGGQVRNQDNQVLDFLNRETVSGISAKSQKSKLWRDYPGMIPTQEMADAFTDASQSTGLHQGAANAKTEFKGLLEAMQANNDQEGIKHLKKSLNAISSNLTGSKLDPKLSPEETIEAAISNMETFASNQQKQMEDVGKLMKLQVNIDKLINGKIEGVEPSQEQIDEIKAAYSGLGNAKGIAQKDGGLEWVKTDAEKQAHKGNLESYINQRAEKLGLKEPIKEFSNSEIGEPLLANNKVKDNKSSKETEPSFFDKLLKMIKNLILAFRKQDKDGEIIEEVASDGLESNKKQVAIATPEKQVEVNKDLDKATHSAEMSDALDKLKSSGVKGSNESNSLNAHAPTTSKSVDNTHEKESEGHF